MGTCGRQVGRLSLRFRGVESRQNSWYGVMCADMEGMRVLRPSCTKYMSTELGWVVTMCLCALGRSRAQIHSPSGWTVDVLFSCSATLNPCSCSAMLDVSVDGLDGVEEAVGGWLGVDGALNAGEEPVACRERV